MAFRTWEISKIEYCEHVGHEIALESQVVYPAEHLPDQPPRVVARRCSNAWYATSLTNQCLQGPILTTTQLMTWLTSTRGPTGRLFSSSELVLLPRSDQKLLNGQQAFPDEGCHSPSAGQPDLTRCSNLRSLPPMRTATRLPSLAYLGGCASRVTNAMTVSRPARSRISAT
jgi:hypothetical protein